MDNYLISKDNGKLQIPYEDYMMLLKRKDEARKIMKIQAEVSLRLKQFLNGSAVASDAAQQPVVEMEPEKPAAPVVEETKAEKVAVEFPSEEPKGHTSVAEREKPAKNISDVRKKALAEIPPIKKEIEDYFNYHDESGRLLNVFKQYYTCLNETCGGIVRVTMKDGVCSLWNYDEWEEFAFIDVHEGDLRIAVDPRYTGELDSLNGCEVPRVLASRRSLTAVQAGDLNKTMLNVLTKAFAEIGLATS